jgi:uncharacterized protein (DUF433 family)
MPEDLIVSDPKVMMGKPTVAGTRVTVELILEKLAAGETVEEILDEHPRLTEEGIRAALSFAGDALRADVIYPVRDATG